MTDAVKNGAHLLTGGEPTPGPGTFYPPTVLADCPGGAPGGASEPRRASGTGFGFGPELLDEMTAMKVVHWSPPGADA